MYFNRRCKATFICHGATIYSEEVRFSHIENYPPLSDLGQDEIDLVCKFLKNRGVKNNVIYASPATRTIQTTKLVSKVYKQDYTVVDALTPRDCGKLNGLTVEQVDEKSPEALQKFFTKPEYDEELQAEGLNDFVKRTGETINKLIDENEGNRIIIVTYPEAIQAAICSALELPVNRMSRIFIRTGSLTQISYFEKMASLIYSDYKPMA